MALPTPIPHPLSFFDAPGWMGDALEWVVGVDWPEGDEKAMRDLADEWHAAGQRLGPLLDEADHAALSAVAAFGGPQGREAEALLTLWRKLGGGPESAMVVVHEFLSELGNLVDAGANEIEGVKLEFYIELALLLIELLTLIATAVLTFGGSLAAAGPINAGHPLRHPADPSPRHQGACRADSEKVPAGQGKIAHGHLRSAHVPGGS